MSLDTSEIVVGGNGRIYVAATTATAPDDATTDVGAGWADLGFASEAGVTIEDSKTLVSIGVWQSPYPARRIVQDRNLKASFVLRQWNAATVALAFGGGLVEANGDEYQYTPPSAEVVDERSMVIDWVDDEKHYRLYIPKGLVTDAVSTTVARTAAADLPIGFEITTPDAGADVYTLFTDDPSFADYGSG